MPFFNKVLLYSHCVVLLPSLLTSKLPCILIGQEPLAGDQPLANFTSPFSFGGRRSDEIAPWYCCHKYFCFTDPGWRVKNCKSFVTWQLRRKTPRTQENSFLATSYPPQIPHRLPWAQTRPLWCESGDQPSETRDGALLPCSQLTSLLSNTTRNIR